MSRTLDQAIASLPARRRRKVEARANELIAEEASLRDLRKAMVRTQSAREPKAASKKASRKRAS